MKSAIRVLICVLGMISTCSGQNVVSGKDIYRINCGAIVGISAGDHPGFQPGNEFGVGFITSENGQIMTANHVITTRESGLRQYAKYITVFLPGRNQPYLAETVNQSPSQDQVNYDAAVIKIAATKLPYVRLGNWKNIEVGDSVTVLSTYPGFGCLLLQGEVSAKASVKNGMGPKPVNTILFQIPIRNGFSGSPIFNKEGKVIGIEDTKVFGISPALGQLRDAWGASQRGGHVAIMGIDIAGSFTQVINNLDQNLISGLGSGVAVEYAKEAQEKTTAK